MVVGVYADHTGRGPTKARTYIDEDLVVCLLEDTLTRAERTLHEKGRGQRLTELRALMQEEIREPLVEGMERLSGRRVRGMVSGSQLSPDLASHVFLLGEQLAEPGVPASARA